MTRLNPARMRGSVPADCSGYRSASASRSRAFSQSRLTVRSVTPSASAISGLGHAGEIAHLHDLDHARVELRQLIQRLMNAQDLRLACAGVVTDLAVEGHVRRIAAASFGHPFTHVVDDDGSHRMSGIA